MSLQHGMTSSARQDWRTPKEIYDFFMFHGCFDVALACDAVGIHAGFCMHDDGLTRFWPPGRVFCNPPFCDIAKWVDKALQELLWCDTVLLAPFRPDASHWQRILKAGHPVFVFDTRLKFDDGKNSAPFTTALAFIGQQEELMLAVERKFFGVWLRAFVPHDSSLHAVKLDD